uniref:Serine protease 30-like n=1 Tax=Phascolarctos cinereus TaxID=38626 RepID=A0A6P5LVF2_PHACI|nr:serine protease 30-like [Phascolarctos cinereus]
MEGVAKNEASVESISESSPGLNASHFSVLLGSHHLDSPSPHALEQGVRQIVWHPAYTSLDESGGDIALVQCDQPAPFSENILPICLPRASSPLPSGTPCWVTGWETLKKEFFSQLPKPSSRPMFLSCPGETCETLYHLDSHRPLKVPVIEHDMVCAGSAEGTADSCQMSKKSLNFLSSLINSAPLGAVAPPPRASHTSAMYSFPG